MMENILVTGGAGYIGSHACKALRRAGYNPVTFDNLSTGWSDAVKFGPLEIGDLRDFTTIENAFKKHKPIAVMHFAALSQVGESVHNPSLYWGNNLYGSLNLINAAVANGCEKFIFSSTCATYGEQDNILLNEDCMQKPINAYGASKLAVENILSNYSYAKQIKFVAFRYFNVAGADLEREIGEQHEPETHLIPRTLGVLGSKDQAITIYGTDYDTRDGTCIRDYVHVVDLVEAHILGLKWLNQGHDSAFFNLGTGVGFSVREVISEICNVTDRDLNIIEGPRRAGDCAKLVSSSLRAMAELGWSCERSNLRQMIVDSWEWHQQSKYLE